jgi:hypothetical protein
MKKVIVSEIADKSAFEEKLRFLFWVFDRIGIASYVKEKSINDFITKTYKKYGADLDLLTKDLDQYGWILKEETLSKVLGEANKKREEHEVGMAVKNNITNWMPKRTWSICINEVVLPRMDLAYFPHEGIAFLFHSVISRFRHWQDSQTMKTDYEQFHPGISFDDLIKNEYEPWQLKELAKVAERNRKRFEEKDKQLIRIYGTADREFLRAQGFTRL